MINKVRRYDIDWLRVLALGLLIIYHIAVIFQPWAHYIYFIQSQRPIEIIWLLMGLINIWRIPLLFIISGMGVCFAIGRRDWKGLLKDRTKRILLPLILVLSASCRSTTIFTKNLINLSMLTGRIPGIYGS